MVCKRCCHRLMGGPGSPRRPVWGYITVSSLHHFLLSDSIFPQIFLFWPFLCYHGVRRCKGHRTRCLRLHPEGSGYALWLTMVILLVHSRFPKHRLFRSSSPVLHPLRRLSMTHGRIFRNDRPKPTRASETFVQTSPLLLMNVSTLLDTSGTRNGNVVS